MARSTLYRKLEKYNLPMTTEKGEASPCPCPSTGFASSTCPHACPGRCAPRSWPISAPRSSRSKAPGRRISSAVSEPLVGGTGSLFHVCNRNKKGMTLELRHPRGREIFLRLIKNTDVVVEAFRPGTMERMKIGYDVLKEANPGLIYCALTAFGQDRPLPAPAGP